MNTMTREVTGVEVTETMDYWYDIVTRKEYRVKVIRRVGPHQVEDQDGNLVQVTESVTFEASPPMGTCEGRSGRGGDADYGVKRRQGISLDNYEMERPA